MTQKFVTRKMSNFVIIILSKENKQWSANEYKHIKHFVNCIIKLIIFLCEQLVYWNCQHIMSMLGECINWTEYTEYSVFSKA